MPFVWRSKIIYFIKYKDNNDEDYERPYSKDDGAK